MSDNENSLAVQNNLLELELFREQWQTELRRRPAERLALTSQCSHAAILESEPHDISRPIVAIWTCPDDVLCEIFYAVASLLPPKSMEEVFSRASHTRPRLPYFRKLGWMELTHVCQRWRDLLLLGAGMGHLWGSVAFKYPSIAAFPTLFSRSRNAPVDILFQTLPGLGSSVGLHPLRIQAALASLPRTYSLKIRSAVSSDLLAYFVNPLSLPSLHQLDLKLEYGHNMRGHGFPFGFGVGLPVPQAMAMEEAPTVNDVVNRRASDISIEGPNVHVASIKLSRLISGVPLLPGLRFSLPRLRHLGVYIYDHTTQISDLRWLVLLLRSAPLLEKLSLTLTLAGYTPNWDTLLAGAPVQLLHLKQLGLRSNETVDLAPLIAQVCLTPPAFISVRCSITQQAAMAGVVPQPTMRFIHNFGGYLCRPGHRAFLLSAALCTSMGSSCSVVAQSIPVLNDTVLRAQPDGPIERHIQEERTIFVSLSDSVKLSFKVPTRIVPPDGHTWLEALSSRIPNKGLIEQLHLRIPTGMPGNWMEACRQHILLPMTALWTMCILEPLHFHAEPVTWRETIFILLPSQPPTFPILHTLIVSFCAETFLSHAKQQLEEWWIPLIQMLTQRHAHDMPIHTLRILGKRSYTFSAFMQGIDEEMMGRALSLVTRVVDERTNEERATSP